MTDPTNEEESGVVGGGRVPMLESIFAASGTRLLAAGEQPE